jgi:hypothetical protein
VQIPLPLGPQAKQVSAGNTQICVLFTNGDVRCLGRNALGSNGNGDTTSIGVPSPGHPVGIDISSSPWPLVNLPGKATAIFSGGYHNCAILQGSNDVACWGANSLGQSGISGGGIRSGGVLDPILPLLLGKKAIDMALGELSSCVQYADLTVDCWGYGFGGAARNPKIFAGRTIKKLNSTNNVDQYCATLDNGAISCWHALEFVEGRKFFDAVEHPNADPSLAVDLVTPMAPLPTSWYNTDLFPVTDIGK